MDQKINTAEEEEEEAYNNDIQLDFIDKLKKRYLSTEDTINSSDKKVHSVRTNYEQKISEDVKNMLKTRLEKKISGSEHAEWQSAKYKTMKERLADGFDKKAHGEQGAKVRGLNDFEHCALFLLNESNYCYNTWLKITFLNYLSSNKKQWTHSKEKNLAKKEIEKQLKFFELMEKGENTGGMETKNNELAGQTGFKGYIAPENDYLLRMIFIDNMIKGIELFYHLLVVAPDKLMREGPEEQSKRDKQGRKDLLASAGVDENLEGYGEDFLEWGKKGIARGQEGGFLTKTGCWIVTKVAFCAFMWAIISNNFAEKIDNFLPEMEHIFQVNFRDYTPRIASDFSETRKEFTKIMLEYSGEITRDGDIMFGEPVKGVTKVPTENIKDEMKRRNAEHLKEIKTLQEIVNEKYKQTIGIIKALPSPETVFVSSTGAVVIKKEEEVEVVEEGLTLPAPPDSGDGADLLIPWAKHATSKKTRPPLSKDEHEEKKKALLDDLEAQKKKTDEVFAAKGKLIEDDGDVGNTNISVSYGHIIKICGESPWDVIIPGAQNKKIDAISDIESRIIAAMGRDGAKIIKKRIIASKEHSSQQGNREGFGSLADTASNFFAYYWKGNDARYVNAPGAGEDYEKFSRRGDLIRKDIRNWESSLEFATSNFIKDIFLHLRITGYWFWIYFTFMGALELYAVRLILKFIPGTTESRERRRHGEFGEGGRLLSKKMLKCCRKVRTEEIAGTITEWEDRGISGIGDATSLVVHDARAHPEAQKRGVRWVVKGVKYMLIVALFRGIAESMRMALQKPREPYTFTFNDIMKPVGDYVKSEFNTGDVFKMDTRIPQDKNPTPRYYAPVKEDNGGKDNIKKFSKKKEEDNVETIYMDDNLYTDNEDDDDKRGSMVAFTYIKNGKNEEGTGPKYHIVGMSFSDTPLVGQLAHIRRVTEPDMYPSAPSLLQRGVSEGSAAQGVDEALEIVQAPPNIKDWRTLNGISINDGDLFIKKELDKDPEALALVLWDEAGELDGGGRKIKRKRKKTRRKKRKGGRKKTRRKRKRKKTRKKRKKLRRKKTRRKR